MTKKEVEGDYEANTGKVTVETFKKQSLSPEETVGAFRASREAAT